MVVTFGNPDPVDKWSAVADACRGRRSEWATPDFNVNNPASMASDIKKGRLAAFRPTGSFEAKQAQGKLWIRYVGEVPTT